MKRIYLDVCALCRPFDNQAQARIRVETSSIELILANVRRKKLELIVSPAHDVELTGIRESGERLQLRRMIAILGSRIHLDLPRARDRANELSQAGFGLADAAHIAFAEQAEADFVSVDDRLLKRASRTGVNVWCGTPLAYCDREALR